MTADLGLERTRVVGVQFVAETSSQSAVTTILEIENVRKRFGGFVALDNCSLQIESGKISGLIGPNGAGKSTLFNIVAGVFRPDHGCVRLNGKNVTGLPAHKMFEHGLLRTFQIPHEYSNMATIENLLMVPAHQQGEKLFQALFCPSSYRQQENEIRQKAKEILDFVGLGKVQNELAGNLSGGQKKLLELGRTLMVDAEIVLLDELGAGVNRTLLNKLADNIRRLNQQFGKTFFIIEHNMDFISKLCHEVTVLVEGKVAVSGSPNRVLTDPAVVEAYFGGGVTKT